MRKGRVFNESFGDAIGRETDSIERVAMVVGGRGKIGTRGVKLAGERFVIDIAVGLVAVSGWVGDVGGEVRDCEGRWDRRE